MPNRQEHFKKVGASYNPKAKLDTSQFVNARDPKVKKKEELKSKLAVVIWRSKNAYHKLNPLD